MGGLRTKTGLGQVMRDLQGIVRALVFMLHEMSSCWRVLGREVTQSGIIFKGLFWLLYPRWVIDSKW